MALPHEPPGLFGLTSSSDGRRAYAAATRGDVIQGVPRHFVAVVDGMTEKLEKMIALPDRLWGLVLSPSGDTLFVWHYERGALSVVDILGGQVVRTIRVGGRPTDLAVHPSGRHVFVADALRERVLVVDAARHRVVATVDRCH